MKNLQQDLEKKEFKKVYLLYGEETYLKNLYKNKLKKELVPEEGSMNFSYYEGKGINVREVIENTQTMPFFAEKRMILIENSGFFKNANEEMANYIAEIPVTACMVFVETDVDKRGRMFKAVKAQGAAAELTKQDEKTLIRWILGSVKKEKKNITERALHLFLEKTGTDMENIQKELEKLFCYTLGQDSISEQDVEMICTTRTVNKIFDMINAMAEKKQKRALNLYYDLLSLKEPPMRILFLITRQFNLLMQVKELKEQGFDQTGIASKVGLQSFIVKNYIRQAQAFSNEQLRQAVLDCVEAEEAVKTGRMDDSMSVELLIVRYSSEKSI